MATVSIDGETVSAQEENGYVVLTRKWKKGETISIDFPMEVKEVITNSNVVENRNKVALEYGPIVYAVEEIDNKENYLNITVNPTDTFEVKMNKQLLGGVNTLKNETLMAIPYYAWSNRGVGKMKVWLNYK